MYVCNVEYLSRGNVSLFRSLKKAACVKIFFLFIQTKKEKSVRISQPEDGPDIVRDKAQFGCVGFSLSKRS